MPSVEDELATLRDRGLAQKEKDKLSTKGGADLSTPQEMDEKIQHNKLAIKKKDEIKSVSAVSIDVATQFILERNKNDDVVVSPLAAIAAMSVSDAAKKLEDAAARDENDLVASSEMPATKSVDQSAPGADIVDSVSNDSSDAATEPARVVLVDEQSTIESVPDAAKKLDDAVAAVSVKNESVAAAVATNTDAFSGTADASSPEPSAPVADIVGVVLNDSPDAATEPATVVLVDEQSTIESVPDAAKKLDDAVAATSAENESAAVAAKTDASSAAPATTSDKPLAPVPDIDADVLDDSSNATVGTGKAALFDGHSSIEAIVADTAKKLDDAVAAVLNASSVAMDIEQVPPVGDEQNNTIESVTDAAKTLDDTVAAAIVIDDPSSTLPTSSEEPSTPVPDIAVTALNDSAAAVLEPAEATSVDDQDTTETITVHDKKLEDGATADAKPEASTATLAPSSEAPAPDIAVAALNNSTEAVVEPAEAAPVDEQETTESVTDDDKDLDDAAATMTEATSETPAASIEEPSTPVPDIAATALDDSAEAVSEPAEAAPVDEQGTTESVTDAVKKLDEAADADADTTTDATSETLATSTEEPSTPVSDIAVTAPDDSAEAVVEPAEEAPVDEQDTTESVIDAAKNLDDAADDADAKTDATSATVAANSEKPSTPVDIADTGLNNTTEAVDPVETAPVGEQDTTESVIDDDKKLDATAATMTDATSGTLAASSDEPLTPVPDITATSLDNSAEAVVEPAEAAPVDEQDTTENVTDDDKELDDAAADAAADATSETLAASSEEPSTPLPDIAVTALDNSAEAVSEPAEAAPVDEQGTIESVTDAAKNLDDAAAAVDITTTDATSETLATSIEEPSTPVSDIAVTAPDDSAEAVVESSEVTPVEEQGTIDSIKDVAKTLDDDATAATKTDATYATLATSSEAPSTPVPDIAVTALNDSAEAVVESAEVTPVEEQGTIESVTDAAENLDDDATAATTTEAASETLAASSEEPSTPVPDIAVAALNDSAEAVLEPAEEAPVDEQDTTESVIDDDVKTLDDAVVAATNADDPSAAHATTCEKPSAAGPGVAGAVVNDSKAASMEPTNAAPAGKQSTVKSVKNGAKKLDYAAAARGKATKVASPSAAPTASSAKPSDAVSDVSASVLASQDLDDLRAFLEINSDQVSALTSEELECMTLDDDPTNVLTEEMLQKHNQKTHGVADSHQLERRQFSCPTCPEKGRGDYVFFKKVPRLKPVVKCPQCKPINGQCKRLYPVPKGSEKGYGLFKCTTCGDKWGSSRAVRSIGQECFSCAEKGNHTLILPFRLEKWKPKPKKAGILQMRIPKEPIEEDVPDERVYGVADRERNFSGGSNAVGGERSYDIAPRENGGNAIPSDTPTLPSVEANTRIPGDNPLLPFTDASIRIPKNYKHKCAGCSTGICKNRAVPKSEVYDASDGNTVSTRASLVTNSSIDKSEFIDRDEDFSGFEGGDSTWVGV